LTWAWKRRRGERLLPVVDALVSPGDAVVDIGANWGMFTARLACLVGRRGQVDAFEPHPHHARSLSAIARRRPQVTVHATALSNVAGEAQLHVPVVGGRSVTALGSLVPIAVDAGDDVIVVPTQRLDDVLAHRRGPSFIKCDVEGLELRVLRGAEATLRRTLPVLLVEIEQRHQKAPVHETFAYLSGLGYDGWFLGPAGLGPLTEFDLERHQLVPFRASQGEQNVRGDYVADFLFAAPGLDVARLG